MYFTHVEFYSDVKRNGVLTNATAWVNLEKIIWDERSQAQKLLYDPLEMPCLEQASP